PCSSTHSTRWRRKSPLSSRRPRPRIRTFSPVVYSSRMPPASGSHQVATRKAFSGAGHSPRPGRSRNSTASARSRTPRSLPSLPRSTTRGFAGFAAAAGGDAGGAGAGTLGASPRSAQLSSFMAPLPRAIWHPPRPPVNLRRLRRAPAHEVRVAGEAPALRPPAGGQLGGGGDGPVAAHRREQGGGVVRVEPGRLHPAGEVHQPLAAVRRREGFAA